jgi:hypothetical protein
MDNLLTRVLCFSDPIYACWCYRSSEFWPGRVFTEGECLRVEDHTHEPLPFRVVRPDRKALGYGSYFYSIYHYTLRGASAPVGGPLLINFSQPSYPQLSALALSSFPMLYAEDFIIRPPSPWILLEPVRCGILNARVAGSWYALGQQFQGNFAYFHLSERHSSGSSQAPMITSSRGALLRALPIRSLCFRPPLSTPN